MITRSFYPSAYYPEYFKADIGLGTRMELPFSKAVDQMLFSYFMVRMGQVQLTSPSNPPTSQVRIHLENMGFSLAGLNELQCHQLFQNRFQVFGNRGTLTGLELLAQSHFSSFSVGRGVPYRHPSPSPKMTDRIQLSEAEDQTHWISFRLYQEVPDQVVQTFLSNSRLIISQFIRVWVAQPYRQSHPKNSNEAKKAGWNLAIPTRMTGRKI
jgi:hypothetical protein